MSAARGDVSGHYAGAFSRLAAFIIDWVIIAAVYGVLLVVGQRLLALVGVTSPEDDGWLWLVGLAVWGFLYMAVGLTISGRTIGKVLLGLKVVTRSGLPLGVGRASARVLAMPLSFAVFGLGLLGVILGSERRALHDVIAGTAVVYDWGDRPAEMPAPLTRWLERRGVPVADQAAAEPAQGDSPSPALASARGGQGDEPAGRELTIEQSLDRDDGAS